MAAAIRAVWRTSYSPLPITESRPSHYHTPDSLLRGEENMNTLLHTRLEKVASGVWGLVTALDDWMGGTAHSVRYREQQDLRETQILKKTRNLIV